MVKEVQYTNIRRVLEDILDHPLLSDVTLEQVVKHVIRFMCLHGYSRLYQDKIANVEIKDYRGVLPCDLVSIVQVKDLKTHLCMRAMTDSFTPGLEPMRDKHRHCQYDRWGEATFKTQGQVIYTSFPEGCVEIAYKAIPVDDEGFPMVIDNENYLACLESYIKMKVFTVKFETGKLSQPVLRNAQIEYGDLCDQLRSEFQTPSYAEAEALSRYHLSLIPRVREFDRGFRHLGSREYLINH